MAKSRQREFYKKCRAFAFPFLGHAVALRGGWGFRPDFSVLGFNELARHIEPESRALDVCFACVFGAREFLEKMRSDFCADTNICIFYSCQEKQKGVLW